MLIMLYQMCVVWNLILVFTYGKSKDNGLLYLKQLKRANDILSLPNIFHG